MRRFSDGAEPDGDLVTNRRPLPPLPLFASDGPVPPEDGPLEDGFFFRIVEERDCCKDDELAFMPRWC